ncbi:MAG: O-antigen ligase family protein [Caldilineales bacterium]
MAALLSSLAFFVAAVRSPDLARALGTTSVGSSTVNRAILWRDGLGLVSDYPFTGSGLRSTMMVYSTYGLLMHVGFILHMHNLFVQIAVSQGVVAALAFAGLLAAAIANLLAATRSRGSIWRFSLAAGAGLAALMTHGMVDAGVYASTLTPVMFLPIGFALALKPGRQRGRRESMNWVLAVAIVSVAALALVVFLPAGRAALQENLGASRKHARSCPATAGPTGRSRTSCAARLRSIWIRPSLATRPRCP